MKTNPTQTPVDLFRTKAEKEQSYSIFDVDDDRVDLRMERLKMIEDFIYELIPVLGFAMIASTLFILIVMRKTRDAFKFIQFFAVADLISGIGMVYAGFHGVFMTIYGEAGENVQPIHCIPRALHLFIWVFSDCFQMIIMCWFALDRLLLIAIPVKYTKIADRYMHRYWLVIAAVIAAILVCPIFEPMYETRMNDSLLIPALCRLEEVIGADVYTEYIIIMQWIPVTCLGICFLVFLLYICRHTKQKWSYNWSEKKGHTKQLLATIVIRAFMVGIAIHVPLLCVYKEPTASEYALLKDFLIRISVATVVVVLQPAMYLIINPEFGKKVYLLFNKYSHNTKRQWQSAADPPNERDNDDESQHKEFPEGTANIFGSWYSSAGNVVGEAGIPLDRAEQERSVSFYYQDSPKGSQKTPPQKGSPANCPPKQQTVITVT